MKPIAEIESKKATEPEVVETWCIACNAHLPGETDDVLFCDPCFHLSHFERAALIHLNEATMLLGDIMRDVHCMHHAMHEEAGDDIPYKEKKEFTH